MDSDTSTAGADAPEATPEPPTVHGYPLTDSLGQAVVHVPRDGYIALLKQLVTRGCSRARAFRGRSSDGLNSRIDRGTRSMRFTG